MILLAGGCGLRRLGASVCASADLRRGPIGWDAGPGAGEW